MLSVYYTYLCRTGFHFGGVKLKTKNINFQNYPSFLGKRSNLMIIDLRHTIYSLRVSLFFLIKIITLRGKILGIETREFLRSFFFFFFKKAKHFFFYKKWLAGFLTNHRYFQGFMNRVKYKALPRKLLDEYGDYFFGVDRMRRLPNFIVFSEGGDEMVAAHSEAARLGIPNVSFYDFFDNISGVTFPVPGKIESQDALYFLGRLFYSSVVIGNYKEIFLFFRKNLYLAKLNRETFLTTYLSYGISLRGVSKAKKIVIKNIYRPHLRVQRKKKFSVRKIRRLKKISRMKIIKLLLKNNFFFQRFYKQIAKISIRKNIGFRVVFNHIMHRKFKKNCFFKVGRFLFRTAKKFRYLNIAIFKYLNFGKSSAIDFFFRKKLKFFLKKKKINYFKKPIESKKSLFLASAMKKNYFNNFFSLNFVYRNCFLRYKKILDILIFNKKVYFKKKLKEKSKKFVKKLKYFYELKVTFSNNRKGRRKFTNRMLKVNRLKRLKFRRKFKRFRRRGKFKSLKYMQRFFICKNSLFKKQLIGRFRSLFLFRKFEFSVSKKIRLFLLRKYLCKRLLLRSATIFKAKKALT